MNRDSGVALRGAAVAASILLLFAFSGCRGGWRGAGGSTEASSTGHTETKLTERVKSLEAEIRLKKWDPALKDTRKLFAEQWRANRDPYRYERLQWLRLHIAALLARTGQNRQAAREYGIWAQGELWYPAIPLTVLCFVALALAALLPRSHLAPITPRSIGGLTALALVPVWMTVWAVGGPPLAGLCLYRDALGWAINYGSEVHDALTGVQAVLVLAVYAWLWRRRRRRSSAEGAPAAVGVPAGRARSVLTAAVASAAVLCFMYGPAHQVEATAAWLISQWHHAAGHLGHLLVGLMMYVVIGPVSEEAAWRGLLFDYAEPLLGETGVLMFSSVLFASMHLEPGRLGALVVAGLVFGVARLATRRIWPSAVAHSLNNLLAARGYSGF